MSEELHESPDAQTAHPLDPLSEAEVTTAREVLEAEKTLGDAIRYVKVVLDEPTKTELDEYDTHGLEPPRRAFIRLRDIDEKATYEAEVAVDRRELLSYSHVENVQPSITLTEFELCEETVKSHPGWQEAVRKRGVENLELAMVDPWSVGHQLVPDDVDTDRRLAHGMTFIRVGEKKDNGYARPLDNIHTWVDLDEMEVVKFLDRGVKEPDVINNLEDAKYLEKDRELREDLTPYNVDQPAGPSWEIEGRKVTWQNWEFRVGWTHREGLVLHDLGYEDDGTVRSVINRASCAEMAVPYGDRDPNHNWKNAFDVGEYNIGRLANSLTEGCDCLGYMHYFDGIINDTDGEPLVIPNAICLHEEDYGTLWKHTDWRTEETAVRRNRRLTVSFVATVGNYDYEFNWYLYQDGSIEGQVRLTGIDSAGLTAAGDDESGFSEMLAPQIKGMVHQHFFNFRLDMEIDGTENELYRVQNQVVPTGPDGVKNDWPGQPDDLNPAGQAFYAERTQLATEDEAKESIKPRKGRYWQVENPNKTNKVDRPVGYRLLPGENVDACAQPGSSVHERSTFIDNHLWATPYREDERFPAGDYINQSAGGEGLPEWTDADRSLDNEDLVLWYTLGVNHVTRPEDWPILPVHISSFKLEPVNFFDENPAMDVPPEHQIKDISARREAKYEDPEEVAKGDD